MEVKRVASCSWVNDNDKNNVCHFGDNVGHQTSNKARRLQKVQKDVPFYHNTGIV